MRPREYRASAPRGRSAIRNELDKEFEACKKGDRRFPSTHAEAGPLAFKGEAYGLYVTKPALLKRINEHLYETLKKEVFAGKEFV
jgi:hypothetical protein